ncbi:MAG: hypothetical protein KGY61_13395 [Desulfobacterales bacterium]|nr:hypothetical protein [Desulfobacterales bacterium]
MTDQKTKKQTIDELKARYENLNKRKIQAEANLENARNQLEELKAQARQEFGTDDVASLKKMLADMEAENERKRAAYQESLDSIEKELNTVAEKYKQVDTTASDTNKNE